MGGKSSSTVSPTTNTTQQDNRVVLGNGASQIGAFGRYSTTADSNNSYARNSNNVSEALTEINDSSTRDFSTRINDSRDLSTSISDSSTRDFSTNINDSRDLSNRSTTTLNYTGTDGGAVDGAVQLGKLNAGLLQALGEDQGDTVKVIARMGVDNLNTTAGAATNLFATAADNTAASWTHTVDKSADLLDRMLTNAQATITGAQTVATDAMSAYQPSDNKTADTMKYAVIAAAAIAALYLMRKA